MRKAAKGLDFVGMDFVVQKTNLDEMLDFIRLGIDLGVDSVRFNMIRNWGTFTDEEFAGHFVGSAANAHHAKLARILADPLFSHPIVDPGNLWRFASTELPVVELRDRDVMHA